MTISQLVTQTVILHLKEGVDFDSATSSPEVQAFVELTETLKAEPGVVSQLWGPQVEHPDLFVWCVDWESFEHNVAFTKSERYSSFNASFSQVFDLGKAPPLSLFTRWNSDASAAMKSKVTEVAFFTKPGPVTEETKAETRAAEEDLFYNVEHYGGGTGSVLGWVFEASPNDAVPPQPEVGREWLHGAFGYPSVDQHEKVWRSTPQHAEIEKAAEEEAKKGPTMKPAKVPGIHAEKGYFHVHFRSEICRPTLVK